MNSLMKDFPQLGAAWEAKERFYGFYSQKSAEDASDYYKKWLKNLDKSTLSHFKTLRTCMRDHGNENSKLFPRDNAR